MALTLGHGTHPVQPLWLQVMWPVDKGHEWPQTAGSPVSRGQVAPCMRGHSAAWSVTWAVTEEAVTLGKSQTRWPRNEARRQRHDAPDTLS